MNLNLFDTVTLTDAINIIPRMYGRLGELNLFPVQGVADRTIIIDRSTTDLAILPVNAWGAPGTVGKRDDRDAIPILIPQTVHEDGVNAAAVQSIRAFGRETVDPVAAEVARAMAKMRRRHDVTHEWRRAGALKGTILDADGTSTLLNLYTLLGVSQVTVDFVLGTSTTEVRTKTNEVLRNIEDNLGDDTYSSARCLCGKNFFDKLTSHATVKAAYANWQAAQDRLGGDVRRGFTFGDITFEEYRMAAKVIDGTVTKFIGDDDGYVFPEGTGNMFAAYAAPADFNETVNTLGQALYAKIVPTKYDRGYDMHTQSNVLPIVKRPKAVIKVTTSN